MRLVGLTGSIATGKSTVARHLALDARVYTVDADAIARHVIAYDQPAYHALLHQFGQVVLTPPTADGAPRGIDRAALGTLVFGELSTRSMVNNCTHPYIRLEMFKRVLLAFLSMYPLCVLDVPLLYESKLDLWVNRVVVVYW
jgi:dephospho-CoA kinase